MPALLLHWEMKHAYHSAPKSVRIEKHNAHILPSPGIPATKLGLLLLLVGASHLGFLASAWWMGGLARLRAPDRISVFFASTQRTLALGLPLLNLMFNYRPDLGLLCTPLLLQHPMQLIVGSLLTTRLKHYVAEHPDPPSA